MENRMQQSMSSSSSSFTESLFGPKDISTSPSSGHFGYGFGPSSMGLGNESSNRNYSGSSKKQYFGSSKHSTTGWYSYNSICDFKTQRNNGQKENDPIYRTETEEPSYLSSSIYYGAQEVYPPTSHNNFSQHTFKKGESDEDPSASRGNWWQGSLYY